MNAFMHPTRCSRLCTDLALHFFGFFDPQVVQSSSADGEWSP
jgi:hypothetical protein